MVHLQKLMLSASLVVLLAQPAGAGSPADNQLSPFLDDRKIVNVVDDFLTFWDHAKGMNFRRQRRAWFRMVESKHRDYFERAVYRNADADQRRAMLDQFLLRAPWQVAAIREFNKTAVEVVTLGLREFKTRFPEYRQQRDIYIGLSLFGFDGSVRPVHADGGVPDTLCLGADVLSDYSYEETQIVVAHELFHLYHFGFLFKGASAAQFRTAHMPLMIEGMAVAGTEALYPFQPHWRYLHFTPEDLADQREVLDLIGRRYLRMMMQGVGPERYEQWFSSAPLDLVPPRAGYLLGYEVTRRLLGYYTIEQMVRMTPAQLREHAEEQVAAIATDHILLLASAH
jgi:hypothetical protein